MNGNDIIDLSLAKTQSNWQRKGFLEKQFTHKEQKKIHESENPFEMVWRLWSMKESAYKIVVQQQQRRFFAPQKFECEIISETKGKVIFENQTFDTETSTTRKYIYTSINKSEYQKVWKEENINKEAMFFWIEKTLKMPTAKIKKNAYGVPNIYNKVRRISKSCSITHHGNYSGIEFTLT